MSTHEATPEDQEEGRMLRSAVPHEPPELVWMRVGTKSKGKTEHTS